jgi:hypothetical protein
MELNEANPDKRSRGHLFDQQRLDNRSQEQWLE